MRDAVREVWQSCAVQTTVCQNTEVEAYLLWNPQPVDVAEEQHDVFRMPCREHKSGGSIEDRPALSTEQQ